MMNVGYLVSTFMLIKYVYCQGSDVGDFCTMQSTGASGQCQLLGNCPAAVQDLQHRGIPPQTCGFQGLQSIVCCVGNVEPLIKPVTRAPTVTRVINKVTAQPTANVPIVTGVGQKSEQKCMEYKKYAYPTASINLVPGQADFDEDDCTIDSTPLVVGGVEANPQEFPHMALIGFDDGSGRKLWKCGGSLISERFVLTAAHCLFHQEYREPKYIRLGELVLNTEKDDAKPEDLLIVEVFKHPGHVSPSKYNDIALLKMDRNAKLNTYVRPACLNTNPTLTTKKAIATGWGRTGYASSNSTHMLKVVLEYFTNAECHTSNAYTTISGGGQLKYGIVDDSQICAGSHEEAKDTCEGDSGGPLQIANLKDCMYKIVGVTSFGKGCGIANIPGIYTRVSNYIEWIEGIVWP